MSYFCLVSIKVSSSSWAVTNSELKIVRIIHFCASLHILLWIITVIKGFKMITKLVFVVILSIFSVSVECVSIFELSVCESIFCGLFQESEFMNWMYFVIDCLIGQNGRSNKTDRGSAPCSLPTKVQNPRWWILMNGWDFLCSNKCSDVYSIIEQVFGARVGKFAEDKNFKVKIWLFLFWIYIISINVSLF